MTLKHPHRFANNWNLNDTFQSVLGSSLFSLYDSEHVTLASEIDISDVINQVAGGANLTAAGAARPILDVAALNGYPAINHDGLAKNLVAAQASSGNIYSFMVLRIPTYTSGVNARILSLRNGGNVDFNHPDGIAAVLRDGSTSKLFSWYNSGVSGLGASYGDIAAGSSYFTLEVLVDDTSNTITHLVNGASVYAVAFSGSINATNINMGDGLTSNTLPFLWTVAGFANAIPTSEQRAAIRNILTRKYQHY